MRLECLVLSNDGRTLDVLERALDALDIRGRVCRTMETAAAKLASGKFDALIADCEAIEGATILLRSLRGATATRHCMGLAVLGEGADLREAFEAGAAFVLEKPLTVVRTMRTLRAARPVMLRERRQCVRYPVRLEVQVRLPDGRELKSRTENVSSGGMAMTVPRGMDSSLLHLTFALPDSKDTLQARAEVAWRKGWRMGVEFVSMPRKSRSALEDWLGEKTAVKPKGASASAVLSL